jgi:hypothetical protein
VKSHAVVWVLALTLSATLAGCASSSHEAGPSLPAGENAHEVPRALADPPSVESAPTAEAPLTFEFVVSELSGPDDERLRHSYAAGCPTPVDSLRHVALTHWDFEGGVKRGELVIAADTVEPLRGVFHGLFEGRFPIERMQLVGDFEGDDDRSMAANNTSAFNCRMSTGGTRWSDHSYGTAIDLNPVQNPYVKGDIIAPRQGEAFADRTNLRPGMIAKGDLVWTAFAEAGWKWGGEWRTLKDYQHFSRSGR